MTSRSTHVLSLIPIAVLTLVLGYHPSYLLALIAGVLLPEVDTASPTIHRSWLFHTFLPTTVLYQLVNQFNVGEQFPFVVTLVHFITLGMAFHFLFDYVFPKTQSNKGAEWPIKPTFFSAPWGLTWLGLSWLAQWFGYVSIAFLPWLVTDFFA